jgi:hypothetical protein
MGKTHRTPLCRFATPPAVRQRQGQQQGSHQVHTGCAHNSMSRCAGLEDPPAHKSPTCPPPTQTPTQTLTCQLTPVTPRELLPTAPTRPAQWLPCPSWSAEQVSRQLSQHTWPPDWLVCQCRGPHRCMRVHLRSLHTACCRPPAGCHWRQQPCKWHQAMQRQSS